jgi:hypothetical protein
MQEQKGLVDFVLMFADKEPVAAGTSALTMATMALLLVRQSFYAWYFFILYVVLSFSLITQHPLAFCVFIVGALAGLAEFLGKFRDEPIKVLRTAQALTYLSFNGLIAVFAYVVLVAYETATVSLLDQIKVVVVAGLGSMLIMRSRLFNVKIGNEDYAFGPDQIIKVYMRFMEKAIDRVRAKERFEGVTRTMEGIDFGRVCSHAVVALQAAQTLSADELKKLLEKIGEIKADNVLTWQEKSHRLAYAIMDEMGEDFVATIFGERLPKGARSRAPEPPEPSVLEAIPFLGGSNTAYYMAFASNMSFTRLRERLRWEQLDPAKIRAAIAPKKCRLEGYRLVFNVPDPADAAHAVSNLVREEGAVVEGMLYKLTPQALEFLDSTEPGYQRIEVEPTVGRSTVKAYAYTSTKVKVGIKPSPEYVEKIAMAAREAGLSKDYIEGLKKAATG